MTEKLNRISKLIQRQEKIAITRGSLSLDRIESEPKFLLEQINVLQTEIDILLPKIEEFNEELLLSRNLDESVHIIADSYEKILTEYENIKSVIVPPDIENFRKNTEKFLRKSLNAIEMILHPFAPNLPAYQTSDNIKAVTISSLKMAISSLNTSKRNIEGFKRNKYSTQSSSWLSSITNYILKNEVQIFLILLSAVILVVTTILFSIFDYPIEQTIEDLQILGKIFTLSITILWFPSIFMTPSQIKLESWTMWGVVWATLFGIWSYGIGIGIVISIVLFIFPIQRLFKLNNEISDDALPDRIVSKLFRTYAILWLFISLVFIHEVAWLMGLVIWVTFMVFIRGTSYRFFRQTYDMIEDIYQKNTAHDERAIYLVVALLLTSVTVITGLVGVASSLEIVEIYKSIGEFSLILVTILLAVQAILPGINVWSRESDLAKRIREMRFMILANKGLGGFMSTFFFLFVASTLARLFTLRFVDGLPVSLDLSVEFLFAHTVNFTDAINPFTTGFVYSEEITLLVINATIFTICIGMTIYAVTQLYYLFSTATAFLLPIRDALLSTPLQIIKIIFSYTGKREEEKAEIISVTQEMLENNRKLNGYIARNIHINAEVESTELIVAIEFDMDFPEKQEIYELLMIIFRAFFDGSDSKRNLHPLSSVQFSVFRDTYQGRHNIFSLQVNQKQWDFLKKTDDGFSKQYKIEHILGAKITNYVFAESQIS